MREGENCRFLPKGRETDPNSVQALVRLPASDSTVSRSATKIIRPGPLVRPQYTGTDKNSKFGQQVTRFRL